MKIRALLVLGFFSLFSLPAFAQESIFDPENEDFTPPEESSSGRESIFDPENIAEEAPPRRESQASFQRTTYRLMAEMGGLIALPFGASAMDPFEIQSGAAMELGHELSDRTELRVRGQFRYWAGGGGEEEWRTHFEPRLDRAYLTHRRGPWSFSGGQKRNSWGSTDLVRPGDVLDPVDFRDLSGSEGLGAKLAQFSFTTGYRGSDWSLQGVLVPFFQPNRLALFGRDTALASERNPVIAEQLPFLLLAEQLLDPSVVHYEQSFFQSSTRPKDLPKNASVGLRGTKTVANTDLGFGVFYGWDRTPEIHLDEDLSSLLALIAEDGQLFEDFNFAQFLQRNPEAFALSQEISARAEEGETLFSSQYLRRTTVLVDAARYIGSLGVRTDFAFSPRRVFYTENFQAQRRASFFGALGLSYEDLLGGEGPLALILEGFWLHVFDQESWVHRATEGRLPTSEETEVEGQEERLLLFEEGYYGLALAASWETPFRRLVLEAGGQLSLQPGDFSGRFSFRWPLPLGLEAGSVYVRGGANFFLGPDLEEQLTVAGLFSQNTKAFLLLGGRY